MKKIIFVLSFFLLIYTPYIVSAETPYNIIENLEETQGVDIKGIAKDALAGKVDVTFRSVLENILSLFIGGMKDNLPQITKMLSIAILSGMILNVLPEENSPALFAAVVATVAVSINPFSYAVEQMKQTTDSLFLFIQSMMTPVSAALFAGGAASGAQSAYVFSAMQIFIYLCKAVLLPLICVITVFSVCDKLAEEKYLSGICALLKQVLKWGTGLLITVYTVVIALRTQVAAGFDTLAGKSIKYAVGSFVPVVGATLSDSLETVVMSAKAVAGALGVAGILGVGYISAVPLLNVCAVSVCFKLAAAIASVSAHKRVAELISEIGDSISRVAVMLLSVTVMFILSLAMLVDMGGIK